MLPKPSPDITSRPTRSSPKDPVVPWLTEIKLSSPQSRPQHAKENQRIFLAFLLQDILLRIVPHQINIQNFSRNFSCLTLQTWNLFHTSIERKKNSFPLFYETLTPFNNSLVKMETSLLFLFSKIRVSYSIFIPFLSDAKDSFHLYMILTGFIFVSL